MTRKIRIAVLAGGWSGERQVSLKSGKAVYEALNRERYDVTLYDPRDDLETLIRKRGEIDLAFILLHGRFGEDGRIQGMLDLLQIPFVGSGVLASAMALNKRVAKDVFRRAGLPVAEDMILNRGEGFSADEVAERLGVPLVVKPVSEGSSLGIAIAHDRESIAEGIKKAFQYDREVMAEAYVAGTEITCCVLGNQALEALPVVEIVPTDAYAFFDYEAKYTPGATREICPAPIPQVLAQEAAKWAKAAHTALGCRVWSRSDMIIRDETLYLLETNTIPGMTETSLFPLAARAAGMSLSDLLDRMIALSLED
ncbi:MAG: D-alanine--D-alanine ligase [Deltaproteobacteria bacterium]|nr:D-alanine--D-alanine ligase [Deltaproteobacteria bacterium]